MSKCIICGRELTTGEPIEMYDGKCAKCYREQNCAKYPFKQGIYDYQDEIVQLKQQLAEKDKEIEKLKRYADYRFEVPYENVTILGKSIEDIQWLTNSWLRQGGKQLAIQELEKIEELLLDEYKKYPIVYDKTDDLVCGALDRDKTIEIINQQIKELKGE